MTKRYFKNGINDELKGKGFPHRVKKVTDMGQPNIGIPKTVALKSIFLKNNNIDTESPAYEYQTVIIFNTSKHQLNDEVLQFLNERFTFGISFTLTDASLVFINSPKQYEEITKQLSNKKHNHESGKKKRN